MEKTLTKYFWVFNLAMIITISCLLASGTGELVATKIVESLPKAKDEPKERPKPTRKRASRYTPDGSPILSRNIFDSVTGPIYPDDFEDDTDVDDIPTDLAGLDVVQCSNTRIRILVSVADKDDQSWSFASINDGGENKMVHVGDRLDNRTVAGISWRYLFLKGSSDICYIDMFSNEKAPPPKRGRRGEPKNTKLDFKSGVQVISETERIVDRSLVDQVLASPEKFIRSVRIRPQRRNGKIVGYKLRKFRKNSPLAHLGAKRGDIIHAVNGTELTSAEQALNLYSGLRTENDLTFSITRKGKPMDLSVRIR